MPTRPRSWTSAPTGLARLFVGKPGVLGVRRSLTSAAKDDFWKIRKAGVSLLMGKVGDAKPVAFVEDTAVSPEKLPAFFDRFNAILEAHNTIGACYGHADVGCLHIRPILNVKEASEVDKLRAIASEVSDLVLEFGGSMSGEHGDGLARSKWNRKLFGPDVYEAFVEIKRAFDPGNRMNPGKVVADPDPGADLRIGPTYHAVEPETTTFDFSAQGGFARAVELCSGVGACRKTDTGTMCPSYMVTRDEEHTTRGRANALRLVMSGALPADGLAEETLADAMDLCLQCKACKTECPSNVDMSKLKSEYLSQLYARKRVPIGSLLLANIFRFNPIGSAAAPLANWSARQPAFRWLLEKVAGIDRRRIMPTFADESPAPLVPRPSGRPTRRDTRARRAARRLLHDLQPARGRPLGRAPAGSGRISRRACGAALLRPTGDLERAPADGPRPGRAERRPADRRGEHGLADRRVRTELPAHVGR